MFGQCRFRCRLVMAKPQHKAHLLWVIYVKMRYSHVPLRRMPGTMAHKVKKKMQLELWNTSPFGSQNLFLQRMLQYCTTIILPRQSEWREKCLQQTTNTVLQHQCHTHTHLLKQSPALQTCYRSDNVQQQPLTSPLTTLKWMPLVSVNWKLLTEIVICY